MAIQQGIDGRPKKHRSGRAEAAASRPRKDRLVHAEEKSVSIEASSIEEIGSSDRKEILTMVGKEIASGLGSQILLRMLAESGKSMRQVARESGFDVSVLSNIANGKRVSGPELWTLVALAEAMDLDLQLNFYKR